MSVVAQNLKQIQERVSKAATHSVTILGVTKKQPSLRVREAVECGLTHLGNNYVQDGGVLRDDLKGKNVQWHFIGHIQSRKVKELTVYDCIESLDRLEIARLLNERMESAQKKMPVLVEINIGGEESKAGISPGDLPAFLTAIAKMPFLIPSGLMCLPPPLEPVEKRIPYFDQLAELYRRFEKEYPFTTLSMGTSDDFEIALRHGSNHIRVGTVLFGPRT
jgi:PLP dependent protein